MKEWKVVLLLLLTILVSACSGSPETSFDGEGISFTCPGGWKIGEAEYLEEGYYVCVEKEGINDSGLLFILAFDREIDKMEYLNSSLEEMKGQAVFRKLTFGQLTTGNYGSYSGITVDYEASVMGVPSRGKMTIFDVYGRTVFVSLQEAIDDTRKNEKGFKTLEKTFKADLNLFQKSPENAPFHLVDDEAEEIQEIKAIELEEV